MDERIALSGSTILNIIMEGAKNPLYEWRSNTSENFLGEIVATTVLTSDTSLVAQR